MRLPGRRQPNNEEVPSRWILDDLFRQLTSAALDSLVILAAFYIATALRFLDGPSPRLGSALAGLGNSAVLVVAVYLLVIKLWRLDRHAWQFARGSEIFSIFLAVAAGTLVLLLLDLEMNTSAGRPIPISIVLIGGILTSLGIALVRFRWRLLVRTTPLRQGDKRLRALIYGAGELGQHLASRLRLARGDEQSYQVVGFIDDDRKKVGRIVQGILVVGRGVDLAALVTRLEVDLVVLAFNDIPGDRLREIVASVEATDAQVRIVPNVLDVVSGAGSAPLTRDIRVSDLLGRQPASVDIAAGEVVLQDRTVVVTGACGSVGSELCRQALAYGPRHLVLLDNNESGLFDLEIELRPRADTCNLTSIVGDITQRERTARLLDEIRPDVVIHAAAYKHVPLMERFPDEAARVNVIGTLNVLRASVACGAERFVLVSTDKAVEPRSIMGMTKRLAEQLVLNANYLPEAVARLAVGEPLPLCTAVRFGNVLGSRGSVVPTFAKQIDMGGPVTVTHPEMTRYFMDISEAAHLIIQAASLTDGNDLFMLDMGQRIRIDDLARRMIRMRGLRPDVDIPITYSGIRPGEKLHEELIYSGEQRQPTGHPSVHKVIGVDPESDIYDRIEWLADQIRHGDHKEIVLALREIVRATDQGQESLSSTGR